MAVLVGAASQPLLQSLFSFHGRKLRTHFVSVASELFYIFPPMILCLTSYFVVSQLYREWERSSFAASVDLLRGYAKHGSAAPISCTVIHRG